MYEPTGANRGALLRALLGLFFCLALLAAPFVGFWLGGEVGGLIGMGVLGVSGFGLVIARARAGSS
jgi:hypothetical protein